MEEQAVLNAIKDLSEKIENYENNNNTKHQEIKDELTTVKKSLVGDGIDPKSGLVYKVNGVCEILNGNGKKGLIKKVEDMEGKINFIIVVGLFLLYSVKDIVVGWFTKS